MVILFYTSVKCSRALVKPEAARLTSPLCICPRMHMALWASLDHTAHGADINTAVQSECESEIRGLFSVHLFWNVRFNEAQWGVHANVVILFLYLSKMQPSPGQTRSGPMPWHIIYRIPHCIEISVRLTTSTLSLSSIFCFNLFTHLYTPLLSLCFHIIYLLIFIFKTILVLGSVVALLA